MSYDPTQVTIIQSPHRDDNRRGQGCLILINRKHKQVQPVCAQAWDSCFQSILLTINRQILLLINVYFPADQLKQSSETFTRKINQI